ncbi:MAG: FkbM family methyltransferase [Gammaproteobacteria bacterium]|nr:FkbM family methyltransferase [Gammaproteobacteria bacterium]
MEHEAFKEKDNVAISIREKEYHHFLTLSKQNNNKQKPSCSKHLIYPHISCEENLKDLLHRLAFALPKDNNITILIPTCNINQNIIDTLKKKYNSNNDEYIVFISKHEIESNLDNTTILVHNMAAIKNLELFVNNKNIEIIDNEYFSTVESHTLRQLFFNTLTNENKAKFQTLSVNNFKRFYKKHICKKEAFCFTTGPSFDSYNSFNFPPGSLKVICNSIVKNKKFLNYIGGADIVAFADPVFHFGPSNYAENFRQDVLSVVETYGSYIIIPDYNVPLILKHYPQLKNKVIGLPGSSSFNFPSIKDFYAKGSANILSLFMIPIASSIADNIFILGADGRKTNEKYFWKHSSSAQYDDKMENVFLMHPSFFRDRNYSDYYETHCDFLEKLIQFGEKNGKVYGSISKSYIPALEQRWIDITKNQSKLCIEIEERRNKSNEKYDPENDTELVNFDFAVKMNRLYSYIKELKKSNKNIAIYGNGLIGNLVFQELQDQTTVIVDINSKIHSNLTNICHPSQLCNYNYDLLVITVLGREDEIINSLEVNISKIYKIDLTTSAKKIVTIDKKCIEYRDNNLYGPISRSCEISLDENQLINKFLNSDSGTMIDVGAHHGTSAIRFLERNWLVYGYEPDPINYNVIENHLSQFTNFILSNKALSNVSEDNIDFFTSNESTGISSLSGFTKGHIKSYKVSTTTLSHEIKKNSIPKVDFLKIDAEGYDLLILKGYPWDLTKPKIIMCEFEDYKTIQLGYTVHDMAKYLINLGYHVYVSEWYTIKRYGIRHDWKRFFQYNNNLLSNSSWGNLIAFNDFPDEGKIKKILNQLATNS